MTKFLFTGLDSKGLYDLYTSDGTAAGTAELAVSGASKSGTGLTPFDLTSYRGRVYFEGTDAKGFGDLWSSDGTGPGTMVVPVTGNLPGGLFPGDLTVVGSTLFFVGYSGASPTIYVSDGTAAGTHALSIAGLTGPSSLTTFDGALLFVAGNRLWVSDGTTAGTRPLFDPNTPDGQISVDLFPGPVAFGNRILFTGQTSSGAVQLYLATSGNGVTPSVKPVAPINTLAGPIDSTYYVTAWGRDAVIGNDVLNGLTGTLTPLDFGSYTSYFTAQKSVSLGDKLLISGLLGVETPALFATDGTAAGTTLLSTPGTSFDLTNALVLDGTAYFTAYVGDEAQLWQSDGTAAGTVEVTGADLQGLPYRYGNAVDPRFFAALAPVQGTLFGSPDGRSTIFGTINDEAITVYGDSNIVYGGGLDVLDGKPFPAGGGGSDVVTVVDGGYNRIYVGQIGDGATTDHDSVILSGFGNRVMGGDGALTVSGGDGQTYVAAGNGDNSIDLGTTADNTIEIGYGMNVIHTGRASVVQVTGSGGGYDAMVVIAGDHVSVGSDGFDGEFPAGGTFQITGGTGYGSFALQDGSLDTDGGYNTVTLGSGIADVSPGSGYDTVRMGASDPFDNGPQAIVHLLGTHNLITGVASSLNASGGVGSNTFALGNEGAGLFGVPSDSYAVTTGGLYNGFALLDSNTNTITAGSGYDRVTITHSTAMSLYGEPPPSITLKPTEISFAGMGNLLDAGGSQSTVTAIGGTGYGSFITGTGASTITTGGGHNSFTLGAGDADITAGSDHATLVLNGATASLVLQGSGNMVFLNAGAAATIGGGASPDLHVYAAAGIGDTVINGLAADPRAVIALTGGAGGYTSTAQVVVGALVSDGSGGSLLPVGSGSLDFAGVAVASIHASLFTLAA